MHGARGDVGDGLTAALKWQVSSLCSGNGECVAVAKLCDGDIVVKDTKERDGHVLRFSASEWRAFLAGVRAGEFEA
jgi:uncharacterized protein DUF397